MADSLSDRFADLVRARVTQTSPYQPTDAVPGSPEKISVLRRRVAWLRQQGVSPDACVAPSLCLPGDARLPPGKGWLHVVGDNGRIVQKVLVDACDAGEISVSDLRKRIPHEDV